MKTAEAAVADTATVAASVLLDQGAGRSRLSNWSAALSGEIIHGTW